MTVWLNGEKVLKKNDSGFAASEITTQQNDR